MKLFEKLFKRKLSLREKCIAAYGDDFGELYDNLCSGIPIGGFHETVLILNMIEAVKNGNPIKMKQNS